MLTYVIELPSTGKKIGFSSLDNEDFTIPHVIDTIPNTTAGHQLPTQAQKSLCIVDINGEEPIT